MSEATARHLLPEFVGAFVPLEIMNLEQRGGPTPLEFAAAKEYWINMMDRGEGTELFYLEKGKTARTVGMLVRLIACMAFQPGGIKIFGHHFVASDVEVALFEVALYQLVRDVMGRYVFPPEIKVEELRGQAARRRTALVAGGCCTYTLGYRTEIPSIVCLCCGLGSTHPQDIAQRFCSFCKEFHAEWKAETCSQTDLS